MLWEMQAASRRAVLFQADGFLRTAPPSSHWGALVSTGSAGRLGRHASSQESPQSAHAPEGLACPLHLKGNSADQTQKDAVRSAAQISCSFPATHTCPVLVGTARIMLRQH